MARKFAKIKPSFWRMKKLKLLSTDARLLAIYLMTCEHFQMVGIYRLPCYFMSHDTGLNDVAADLALTELVVAGFCCYDYELEVVWVVDMATSQVADNPNSKQLKGVRDELTRLHFDDEFPFVPEFLSRYAAQFGLPESCDDLAYELG